MAVLDAMTGLEETTKKMGEGSSAGLGTQRMGHSGDGAAGRNVTEDSQAKLSEGANIGKETKKEH